MADWSELPPELLVLIARRLHLAEDYAKFGAVCKSWRAVVLEKDNDSCSLLPWLMHTVNEENSIRGFSCLFKHKVYHLYLPELHGRRCWGSSHGWLVTLDDEYQMHLFNPISRVQILLPPLLKCPNLKNLICSPEEFRNRFVHKVILSSDPLSGDCMVLAIYSKNKMAVAKPGDDAWTPIQCSLSIVDDAIFFGGNFYATDCSGDVMSCDLNGNHLKTVNLKTLFQDYGSDHIATYIVEIGGYIHVILRIIDVDRYVFFLPVRTRGFKIYRLDACTKKWEKVTSLGNWSVFVGCNHSFSISSCDYPECRRNCIYFSDDSSELFTSRISPFSDMGIYSVDDRKIKPFIPPYAQPVWIKPILN